MLSLVRGGPHILVATCLSAEPVERILATGRLPKRESLVAAIDASGEGETLFALLDLASGTRRVVVSHRTIEEIFRDLVNSEAIRQITHVECAAGMIVMRLLGDPELAIERLLEYYGAEAMAAADLLTCFSCQGSALYFTKKPLNMPLSLEDFYPTALSIPRSPAELLHELKEAGTEYLSIALGSPQWNDIDLKIYDAEDRYDIHRRRILLVLRSLELGVVVGEKWGKDYAFTLMPISIYQMHIFSPLDVQEIKRIMMGLEYDVKDERIVDLDVEAGKEKASWTHHLTGAEGETRVSLARACREELLRRLPSQAREELLEIEREIPPKPL